MSRLTLQHVSLSMIGGGDHIPTDRLHVSPHSSAIEIPQLSMKLRQRLRLTKAKAEGKNKD